MERLTKKIDSFTVFPEELIGVTLVPDNPIMCKMLLRLAAYEDTGLEPEEVLPKDKADEIALKLMRLADLESLCSYDRLRVLAEADKEGRLVVLPCKELCGSVDGAARKILTRGDRIRVMSDAELAGLFFQFRVDAYGKSQGAEDVLPNCMESIEKWLGESVFGCEEAKKDG